MTLDEAEELLEEEMDNWYRSDYYTPEKHKELREAKKLIAEYLQKELKGLYDKDI